MRSRRLLLATLTSALVLPLGSVPAAADDGNGAPSRSGLVVWTTREADGSEHLLIAHADGTHQRVLTPALADSGDIDAQISPDGRWVAYEHDSPDGSSLRLVHPDGTSDHAVDVGCVDPCVAVLSPTWLSRSRLAFTLVSGPFDPVTSNAASAVLWTSNIGGGDVRRLSPAGIDGIFEDYYLRLAPGGSYVTFKRVDNLAGRSALFRARPDGSGEQQLTPWAISADVNDLSTARSGPTKDLLVFESFGRGDPDATFVDIATVPGTCASLAACTADIRWLTDNGATGRRNANPQWSPDGSSLVFTDRPSIDDQNAEIWTMRYGGEVRRKISTSPLFDYRPASGRG